MKWENKNIRKKRKFLEIIGIYEIISGSIGIGFFLYGAFTIGSLSFFNILLILIFLGFYSMTIYAGIKLFKYHEKMITYSKIVQYIQIPSIAVLGFAFTMVAGFSFIIGIDYTNELLFKFNLGLLPSNSEIRINRHSNEIFGYINLIPVFIIYLIDRLESRIKNETKELKIE